MSGVGEAKVIEEGSTDSAEGQEQEFYSEAHKHQFFRKACRDGRMDDVRRTFEEGYLDEPRFAKKTTTLMDACGGPDFICDKDDGGHNDVVEFLLSKGVDVNYRLKGYFPHSNPGWPLSYACWSGNLSLVRLLLDAGADVDHSLSDVDAFHHYPLVGACYGGHKEVVELLIEAGANPRYRSDSPLMAAAKEGHAFRRGT